MNAYRGQSLKRTVQYKQRTITVEVQDYGHGYTWAYQIDGGEKRESPELLFSTPELMLEDALRNAQAEIDRLGRLS